MKSAVVERLKTNTHTKDEDIKIDVKQHVVVLGGEVSSWLAKRAAGARGRPRRLEPGAQRVEVAYELAVVPHLSHVAAAV